MGATANEGARSARVAPGRPDRGRSRALARALGAVAAAALLLGCPGIDGPIPERCVRFAAKCKLPTGPLGVCDRGPCPEGREAPGGCLQCVPQH